MHAIVIEVARQFCIQQLEQIGQTAVSVFVNLRPINAPLTSSQTAPAMFSQNAPLCTGGEGAFLLSFSLLP
jgi:hypothetical protein